MSAAVILALVFQTARWPEPRPVGREPCYGIGIVDKVPFGFWEEMTYFLGRGGAPADGSTRSPAQEPRP